MSLQLVRPRDRGQSGTVIAIVKALLEELWLWRLPVLLVLLPVLGMRYQDRAELTTPDRQEATGLVATVTLDAPTWSLAFSPDGLRLAASDQSGSLLVLHPADGTTERLPRLVPARLPAALGWDPGGQLLAIPERAARAWAFVPNSWQERPLPGLLGRPFVALAPDGRLIAGPCENTGAVGIWTWPECRQIRTLHGSTQTVTSVAFAPSTQILASGDAGGSVSLWELASGRELIRWSAHDKGVSRLAYSPDGATLATASPTEPVAKLWDGATGTPRGAVRTAAGGVIGLAFMPDGAILILAGTDGTVRFVDRFTRREVAVLRASGSWLNRFAIAPNGGLLATGGADLEVRVWDLAAVLGPARR